MSLTSINIDKSVLAQAKKILDKFPRSIQAVAVYMTAYALQNNCCIVTFDKHFLLAKSLFPQLEIYHLPQTP